MKIKINEQEWNSIDENAKKKTSLAVAVFDSEITPDNQAKVTPTAANTDLCDVAYAAAIAICNNIPAGFGRQVCYFAAQQAYNECKN